MFSYLMIKSNQKIQGKKTGKSWATSASSADWLTTTTPRGRVFETNAYFQPFCGRKTTLKRLGYTFHVVETVKLSLNFPPSLVVPWGHDHWYSRLERPWLMTGLFEHWLILRFQASKLIRSWFCWKLIGRSCQCKSGWWRLVGFLP